MTEKFLNYKIFELFYKETFGSARPFPWQSFKGFLTEGGFLSLCKSFPSLELFERHAGFKRGDGQRPHNRYYLAYDHSIYHSSGYRGKGLVQQGDLAAPWQNFIEELKGTEYKNFTGSALGISNLKMRFVWHLGFKNDEVSPHRDVLDKIGFHFFYFNQSLDWKEKWGGQMLLLGEKLKKAKNPDFQDFAEIKSIPFLDNRSFFFKNTREAWHGVRPLRCTPEKYRRLFTVIFEIPDNPLKKIFRRLKRFAFGKPVYPGESA